MSIVISQGYFKHSMEGGNKNQEEKTGKNVRKKGRLNEGQGQHKQKKQILVEVASEQECDGSKDSSGWSQEVIQPAIKTMSFRPKRGTRMKQLMKGKHRKDLFWEKYQNYFGGDLGQPDDSEDQEDYQASSSGRDQFDSDFDLTDSYVGKRGRKKGTKVKRRKKPISKAQSDKEEGPKPPKGRRGRKKKILQPLECQQKLQTGQQLKVEKIECVQKQERVENYINIDQALEKKIQIPQISQQRKECCLDRSSSKSSPEAVIACPEIEMQDEDLLQCFLIE